MEEIFTLQKGLKSWVAGSESGDFTIYNLPFGIFSTPSKPATVGVALGDFVIDLAALIQLGHLKSFESDLDLFQHHSLNPLLKKGKAYNRSLRNALAVIFSQTNQSENDSNIESCLVKRSEVSLHLPVEIGDYTDFYSSKEHATNVGSMFRDPNNALLPNWLHLPVGYHGRSSSICVSGTSFYRPYGQTRPNDNEPPVFGPSKLVDFEVEMGFITFDGKPLGDRINISEAEDYIFGMVLFNDWSARDIQKWEYVPLGPFLAKNFGSGMSPWVVTLDALEPFKTESPTQEPEVLPYLKQSGKKAYDIAITASISPQYGEENVVCKTNFKYMYWTMVQQLAHHTVNGCNIKAGDLCASGTISGPTPDSYGSMLELTWRGTKPITLSDGTERKFIQDYDTVILRGHCKNQDYELGFGEVSNQILPAKAWN